MNKNVYGLYKLVRRCLSEDAGVLRTRVFVGLANTAPDLDTVSTFVRPLLLRLAGAHVAFPASIRRPLFIHYAGNLTIGRWAFINQGFRADGAAPITIGERVLVGPFCCFENVNHRPTGPEPLPITVGDDVWVGCRSVLLPGASVGEGSILAAGSVVRGAVPAREIWGGVPARHIKPAPVKDAPPVDRAPSPRL